jgi:hypothetical protein
MKHWLFNGFAAASMLLCMATVVLWERGEDVRDRTGGLISRGNDIGLEKYHPKVGAQNLYYFIGSSKGHIFIGEEIEPLLDADDVNTNPPQPLPPDGWYFHVNSGYGWLTIDNIACRYENYGLLPHHYNEVRLFDQLADWSSGILLPDWMPLVLFLLFPAIRVAIWVRHRRRNRTGLCAVCGYDLRATPDRCPECGLKISPAGAGRLLFAENP